MATFVYDGGIKKREIKYRFDHLYLIEWDLLYLRPLETLFGKLRKNCNYGTRFSSYTAAKKSGWTWISGGYVWQVDTLENDIKITTGKSINRAAMDMCVMSGTIFCRAFLQKYSSIYPSSTSNDETRLSFWSQGFGIPLLDNGLYSKKKYYIDCNGNPFSKKQVREQLRRGVGALHPMRFIVSDLDKYLQAS